MLGADLHGAQLQMVVASSLALVVLLVLSVLSVYKPRGMTPYGQRKQDEQRQGVAVEDGATNQAQEILQKREGNSGHTATSK